MLPGLCSVQSECCTAVHVLAVINSLPLQVKLKAAETEVTAARKAAAWDHNAANNAKAVVTAVEAKLARASIQRLQGEVQDLDWLNSFLYSPVVQSMVGGQGSGVASGRRHYPAPAEQGTELETHRAYDCCSSSVCNRGSTGRCQRLQRGSACAF